ncbi:hypothetical protein [Corynebacterium comes]|uniref:Uncharacterized protein n=1 Tax=Corynebacterium comes TaxID=2675218 RepID=A0A6B8W4M0_9CORY|nr:hypothetical protein [Corynebacterium comes]QGU04820.1 hypothetical protein CETAM_07830 [Corynebacterium comes]
MPDRMMPSEPNRRILILLIMVISSLIILASLRLQGLLLIVPIAAIAILVVGKRPDESETTALRSSIALSAEDIQDVIDEFDAFSTSPDAQHMADRTLTRPALLDFDCADPDISGFHHEYATAKRFLNRIDARLTKGDLDIPQLETLLKVTDARALGIREAWIAARQSAQRLGPDY